MLVRLLRIFRVVENYYNSDIEMRFTVNGFIKLLPRMISLISLCVIIQGYFALILLKLYKNDFYECRSLDSSLTVNTKSECLLSGGDWV